MSEFLEFQLSVCFRSRFQAIQGEPHFKGLCPRNPPRKELCAYSLTQTGCINYGR